MNAKLSYTLVLLCATSTEALAHLELTQPPSRYGGAVLKSPPCGQQNGARSENVSSFQPGETIVLKWTEYIDHPGHFRVAFDADGDDDFVDPPCLSGCDGPNPEVELYSNEAVLLDDIADKNGGDYEVSVTLPDIECDSCTLQVIQVMTDKPPYTLPGNEMYYQCVDLILSRDAPAPMMQQAGDEDSGCSCLLARKDRSDWLAIGLLFAAGLSRRRKSCG